MAAATSALDGLTPREREIAAAAASGAPAQELAEQLFLSPRTVETHLIRIYRKLGLRSRAELVALVLGLPRIDEAAPSPGEPVPPPAVESRRCPACDAPLAAPDPQFCHSCGAAVTGTAPERRKLVTLLRCAVAHADELEDSLDAEAFRALIDAFYDLCRRVVERHEGAIEKNLGDAVLAVFGVPTAREDDALRGVRAAVEIHEEARQPSASLQTRFGARLMLRIGINTGEAIVGKIRSGGLVAAGEAVNGATRLEQAAGPGETLMGEMTRQLVEEWVACEERPSVAPPGRSQPERRFRLLTLSEQQAPHARSAFVGRRLEIAVLEEALARTIDTQTSALVTIVGEAGLGKTRLVSEFVAGLGPTVKIVSGRCLSYGEGITFWPVVEILRAACDLHGDEPPDVVDDRLGQLLAGHRDAPAVHAQLKALLVPDGVPGSIGDVIRAVVSAVEQLAVRAPVVVCVDDLHWAEPALLDLIEALLQECRDLPVLVAGEARPEFLTSRPTWGSTTVNTFTLRLEPLPAVDAATLVSAHGGLPDDIAARVVAAASGNPLYLEQLAAHAANRTDDRGLAVPPTVTALLNARLDQLDEGDRALVSDASVIGQAFGIEELSALVGMDPTVPARLERLSERQIVRRDRSRRGGYRFQHVLMQQAAYDAHPKAVRARRHRAYAAWLRARPEPAGSELSALCGWHLEQAHRLLIAVAPGDAANRQVAQEAAAALSDASRAREGADPASAVKLLRRAAALTDDKRAKLRRLLRVAYLEMLFSLSLSAVRDTLAEAEALAVNAPAEAALLAQLKVCYQLITSAEPASDGDALVAERARTATAKANWLWGRAVNARLTVVELQTADAWHEMRAHIDDCIEFAGACGERHIRNEALVFRATVLRCGPTPVDEAVSLLSETLLALRDEPEERERVQMELAVLHALAGDLKLALSTLPAQPSTTKTASYLHWAFTRAAIDEAFGDEAAAGELACTAAAVLAAQGDLGYSSTLYGWGGILLGLAADVERAREAAELARSSTPESDLVSQSEWRLAFALVAARAGDTVTAELMVREAMPYVEVSGSPHDKANHYVYAASALRLVGRRDESARLAHAALDLYRRKGATVYERRCEELLGA